MPNLATNEPDPLLRRSVLVILETVYQLCGLGDALISAHTQLECTGVHDTIVPSMRLRVFSRAARNVCSVLSLNSGGGIREPY